MIGQIQSAQKSKSLKTLSVMVDGSKYTSKNWEFEQMVGQRIIFDPSPQSMPDGGSITWINEYQLEGQSTTPATQAMDTAMAGQREAEQPYSEQHPPQGQMANQQATSPVGQAGQYEPVPQRNKDAEIAANGLCHSLRPVDAAQAWENFRFLYRKFNTWNPADDEL